MVSTSKLTQSPGKGELLLIHPPLRTERDTFASFGSSLHRPSIESQQQYFYSAIVYDS
jgi:hypothetical protein